MKKLLALILAAALALSLVACGGDSGAGDTNTPSTGNGDTTSTDTPSMTKEEMLETAEDGNISELNHLIAENILSAKQAYCGKALTFRGNIQGIKEDYITFNHGKPVRKSWPCWMPAQNWRRQRKKSEREKPWMPISLSKS